MEVSSRQKRKHVEESGASSEEPRKKKKKPFTVGPSNLPDSTYRRHNQKIKDNLIHDAKVRKEFERLKKRERLEEQRKNLNVSGRTGSEQRLDDGEGPSLKEDEAESTTAEEGVIHPQRLAMLQDGLDEGNHKDIDHRERSDNSTNAQGGIGSGVADDQEASISPSEWGNRDRRKKKLNPFIKDTKAGEQRNKEVEERKQAREESERQKQEKREERERFRKAMAKARTGGKNGQRKLGRESRVLLEKVKRIVDQ